MLVQIFLVKHEYKIISEPSDIILSISPTLSFLNPLFILTLSLGFQTLPIPFPRAILVLFQEYRFQSR